MPREHVDPAPPYNVSMHVNIRFHHQVSMAENMDAATEMVKSQVEMFMNKAKAEAAAAGIDMHCDYLVTF